MRGRLVRLGAWLLVAAGLLSGLSPWASARTSDQPPDETRRRIRVPILMYHYISVPPPDADIYRLDLSVAPERFAEQLFWLRENGYTAITLDALYEALARGAPLPPQPVILTFDDGYADAYDHAFRLLQEFGMSGTFFVVTDWLDGARTGYLTWAQAREMAAEGMAIESHSRTHPDLTNGCDAECLAHQIAGSLEAIEAATGKRPRFFCYPGGRYDDAVLDVLESAGVLAAVTTQAGTRHTSDALLELRRVRVRGTTALSEFAWLVAAWRE